MTSNITTTNRELKLIETLTKFEALKPSSYLCSAGKLTIGIGHTRFTEILKKIEPLSTQQCLELLEDDLNMLVYPSMNRLELTISLTDSQWVAVASLIFNIGAAAFATSTLRKLLLAQEFTRAADEFLKWDKETKNGVKTVNKGLATRRAKEREIFLKKD